MLFGCNKQDEQTDQQEKLKLPVVKLARQSTTLKKEYIGTLEAVRNVEIRARVSGFLEKIFVDEGQPVRQGQLLFKLNEAEYRSELDKAKANFKSAVATAKTAEVELSRVKLLVDKKVVSSSELELAKAKLDVARAAIDEAKSAEDKAALRLSQANIRAPFDGVINRIPYKMGSLIEEGALLTTVSDTREVYAYFDVSEKEYLAYIKKNRKDPDSNVQTVEMLLADDTKYPHKGKIETMESVFEEGSGTIAFRARFPNPEKLLRHGSSGKVRLANDVGDALLVPQKAVFEVQDKNYVYIVDSANKVKSRSFVPQGRVDHYYLVQSGLQPGERVVYEGIQNVRDGMQIIPEAVVTDSIPTQNTLAQQ
jgi:membrane fusion protein (multidrug efflux system)